jgi:3-hydroxyisobutyrate dehydrogenase-like beta-hydroxyacid dehydrogenase
MQVGFIGLRSPIAANLLAGGHDLTVYNQTKAKAGHLDLLTNTLFGAPVYKTYGKFIAEERYTPAGFSAELGYKDVGLALNAAREMKVPMPLASLISDRFVASRGGDLDWSALALIAKRDAGGETPLHRCECGLAEWK